MINKWKNTMKQHEILTNHSLEMVWYQTVYAMIMFHMTTFRIIMTKDWTAKMNQNWLFYFPLFTKRWFEACINIDWNERWLNILHLGSLWRRIQSIWHQQFHWWLRRLSWTVAWWKYSRSLRFDWEFHPSIDEQVWETKSSSNSYWCSNSTKVKFLKCMYILSST